MENSIKLSIDYLSKLSKKDIDDKNMSVCASIDESKYSMTNVGKIPNEIIFVDECLLVYFDSKIGKITVNKSNGVNKLIISAPSKKDLNVIHHSPKHEGDILIDVVISDELFENFKEKIKKIKKIKERKYFTILNKYSDIFYDGEHDKRAHFIDLLLNKSSLVEKIQDRNIHEITINNVKFIFIVVCKEFFSERYRATLRVDGTLITVNYFYLLPEEILIYNKNFSIQEK